MNGRSEHGNNDNERPFIRSSQAMTQCERNAYASGTGSGCSLKSSCFTAAHDWRSRTISSERIRFVVATEAYGPWWARHRRPGDAVSVLLIRTGGDLAQSQVSGFAS